MRRAAGARRSITADFPQPRGCRPMSEMPLPPSPETNVADSGFHFRPRRMFAAFDEVFDEDRFFLILSVFIGIFSGLAVVCFRLAIDWTHLALLGPLPQTHSWRLFAVPSLAGLA